MNKGEERKKYNEDSSLSEHEIEADETLIYHGMSPDEITLVESAKQVGYEFRVRSNNEIEIKLNGSKKIFKLLELFKFTSDRKRMTIVVQDPDNQDSIIVFTKGADNVMWKLAEKKQPSFNFSFVHEFSKEGYR